jgi:curved DNA-binding protein CbpA
VILFKKAANINFFSSSFKLLRPSMVFMLAYLIGVLLFLESSSALSHYDVLGVSRSSSAETIVESFNKLSEQLKPNKNVNDPDASGRYAALKLAYKILGDATSKEIYDRMLQSSELENNDAMSQQDRGKNMDRVLVGTYIPVNDHAETNSQTVGIISSICSCFSFHHF